MGKRVAVFAAICLGAMSSFAVTTKDTAAGVTAEQIAQLLTGSGITITNAKITGGPSAIGTFTGGNADGLAIDTGAILSSGDIKTAAGPNKSEGTTGSLGQAGDLDLDALVKPYTTHDAVVLEFDAVTAAAGFSIRYVFASEEYKEYVGSQFNDVFAFFVDGQNIALVPGSSEPVAINTINHKKNTSLFNDNPANSGNFGTSFDGFTTELTAFASVSAGSTHHIKIAVADASDSVLDSAVYLAAGGISGGAVTSAVVPEFNQILLSNLESNTMKVTVYGVPDDVTAEISAYGLPSDSTVSFVRQQDLGPNTPVYLMTTRIGNEAIADVYALIIQAKVGTSSVYAHVGVIVDCAPPFILAAAGNQPADASVVPGGQATLRVITGGSTSFKYQWYVGHTGSTVFPIAGGTSAVLTTPAITTPTEFWVRVYNPCGSVDSNSAIVSPNRAPFDVELEPGARGGPAGGTVRAVKEQ